MEGKKKHCLQNQIIENIYARERELNIYLFPLCFIYRIFHNAHFIKIKKRKPNKHLWGPLFAAGEPWHWAATHSTLSYSGPGRYTKTWNPNLNFNSFHCIVYKDIGYIPKECNIYLPLVSMVCFLFKAHGRPNVFLVEWRGETFNFNWHLHNIRKERR